MVVIQENHQGCLELYTDTFKLKGTSFHLHFQNALRKYKQCQLDGHEPALHLKFEPVNMRDENAIVVMSCFNNTMEPIGYVPAVRVQKITSAYNAKQITSLKISTLRREYNYYVGSRVYTAHLSVTKKGGKWPPNSKDYSYNCIF